MKSPGAHHNNNTLVHPTDKPTLLFSCSNSHIITVRSITFALITYEMYVEADLSPASVDCVHSISLSIEQSPVHTRTRATCFTDQHEGGPSSPQGPVLHVATRVVTLGLSR